jgi:hypothetical protein
MSADQYITIAILALTFVLLIKSNIPPVAVFVGSLTLTITFRLAPLDQSLKGFSNSGMLTVGALLMVAAGMYRTGAITLITEKLIGRPKSLLSAQAKILPPVAVGRVAGSDHSNKLFSIKEHPISNGFQVLWGCFQARNIGHNHSSVHGA